MSQTLSTPSIQGFGRTALLLGCLVAMSGCSDLTAKQQRVLTGAVIGTTTGTVVTAATGGCIACGAAIGGAVGAGSGYLYDYVQGSGNSMW